MRTFFGGSVLSKFLSRSGEMHVCAAAVSATADGVVAKRIQLLPMGKIVLRDGRGPVELSDLTHANQVIAATRAYAGRMDLMVDYDHQSHFAAKDGVGGRAPAAGWMKLDTLAAQADGIWVDVEWTEAATAALEGREYRYLSPLFGFDKSSGRVTRIFNAGLTNTPAIDDLAPVAASTQGDPMDLTALAKALGLSDSATIDEIAAACTALKASADASSAHVKAAASALGLTDAATGEEVVAAAKSAGHVDPSKYVPIGLFTDLQTQVRAIQDGQSEAKAAAAVHQAVASGKVTPAQKDWALGYARKDLAGFEAYAAAAAVIVPAGQRETDQRTEGGADVLTAEEKAAASMIGVSEEAFLKVKQQKDAA